MTNFMVFSSYNSYNAVHNWALSLKLMLNFIVLTSKTTTKKHENKCIRKWIMTNFITDLIIFNIIVQYNFDLKGTKQVIRLVV